MIRRIRHHQTGAVLASGDYSCRIWHERNPQARLVFSTSSEAGLDMHFNPDWGDLAPRQAPPPPRPVHTLADYISRRIDL